MSNDWTEYEVLLYANERLFSGTLKTKVSSNSCSIFLSVDIEVKKIELDSSCDDFFNALISIRKTLDKENYMLCCNGSRRDFYPSNMSLQMSKGKVGYLLELGKRASNKSRTLDSCKSLEHLSTVGAQLAFFEKWKESIGTL